jgi:hypothetical protein
MIRELDLQGNRGSRLDRAGETGVMAAADRSARSKIGRRVNQIASSTMRHPGSASRVRERILGYSMHHGHCAHLRIGGKGAQCRLAAWLPVSFLEVL